MHDIKSVVQDDQRYHIPIRSGRTPSNTIKQATLEAGPRKLDLVAFPLLAEWSWSTNHCSVSDEFQKVAPTLERRRQVFAFVVEAVRSGCFCEARDDEG